jgi:hypothetical protein
MARYSRRQMVRFLGGVTAYLVARPIEPEAMQYSQMGRQAPIPQPRQGLRLVLDGMDPAIEVIYRGRRQLVTAEEIFSALEGK